MTKIRPQDNFYDSVNKEWIDNNELPDGYASWGSFEMLQKKSTDDIKAIINELVNATKLDRDSKMIANLRSNYLNDKARNKQGIKPIQPILNKISALTDKKELTSLFVDLFQEWGISFFHSKGVDSDFKDSNLRALMIDSMGLGMSDRDFYEETHPRHEEIKNAYKNYIENLVKLSGVRLNTKDIFNLIYSFEEKISKSMFKQEELREPENIYNVVTIKELNDICPIVDWTEYLNKTGYDKASKIILTEPKYFEKLNQMIEEISLDDLKDIMSYKVTSSYSRMLTIDLYENSFKYGSVFSGVKKMKPIEDRVVEFVDGTLGELISKEYVKRHFSEDAKKDVLKMVNDLLKVYENRINTLDWMSDETKTKAIEKLNSFTIKIGYPDKWEDLSDVEILSYEEGGSLFDNMQSLAKHYIKKELKEINLPVDKTKWYMDAQTVNAYYNPTSNEICFPAGILQKPFYDVNQSHAANLGGIGAVIGHEVSHGFDDEGSKFDKDGNFENWWTETDNEQYKLRTQRVVDQYNEYQINGSNVNGKLTLGENIGDLSGVAAALDICKAQSPNDLKDFFTNYALVWRRKATDEQKNTRLLVDPHSPEEFRCNGVLVNINEFHEVYETKPGDGMYKPEEERTKVW
ncbi:putative membrane metallo endopeptidase [Mesoplasma florum L1]|uniref:Membrane metallo endopeptidase n=1 Tax=Mesoplasma florum (strain ATCC 33453 / NBRC 100688 / NCTC 11704 / L1) TaxID=265311 RepID=Q6F1M5_MESFL|nr:M13 family metallopeptidase [Mesoplasma florum]AAT75598.1 putative membrane metallo endopeptidase [Mesoplasma florum L1]